MALVTRHNRTQEALNRRKECTKRLQRWMPQLQASWKAMHQGAHDEDSTMPPQPTLVHDELHCRKQCAVMNRSWEPVYWRQPASMGNGTRSCRASRATLRLQVAQVKGVWHAALPPGASDVLLLDPPPESGRRCHVGVRRTMPCCFDANAPRTSVRARTTGARQPAAAVAR